MALLSEKDVAFLRDTFERQMVRDVTIALFTQRETRIAISGSDHLLQSCAQANQIMEEVAALSDKIHLEVYDHRLDVDKLREHSIDRLPAMILGADGDRPARFFGVVAGYEFSTLIQDVLDLSTDTIELTDETKETLSELTEDVHIQVFVTPT